MAGVNPIPENYPQLTPYLVVDGAQAAIAFYGAVFGTLERVRLPMPDGTVGHCELQLGNSLIMLSDPFPSAGAKTPKELGGTPVTLSVYVEDVDEVFDRALQEGATVVRPVEDQFYGDRSGTFEDPWGHRWSVQSHIEDVSYEEMHRRMGADA